MTKTWVKAFSCLTELEVSMEEIVIISNNKGQNSQLARLVEGLFSDCKVTVVYRESIKMKKHIKKGDQYVENAER